MTEHGGDHAAESYVDGPPADANVLAAELDRLEHIIAQARVASRCPDPQGALVYIAIARDRISALLS